MKKYYFLIIVALILGLVLTGCLLSNIGQVPTSEQSDITYLTKGVPPNLVALWHFDEGGTSTTTSDSSASDNTGTLVNGPQWVSGKFGNALNFDGENDYVDCEKNVDIITAITIEAWIKPSAFTDYDAIVTNFEWSTVKEGWSFRVMSDKKLVWRAVLSGNSTYSIISNSTMEVDNWYHVVLTHDESYTRLYINGSLDIEETPGGTIVNLGKALKIGWDDWAVERVFDGVIDEVRIWNIALQPNDILRPAISVEKSGPGVAHVGDTITYEYIVSNTGYVSLSNVTVSDDLAENEAYVSGDTNGNVILDVEEDWRFTANYTVPDPCAGPVVNTATATGEYGGQLVNDAESCSITILHPEISLEKSADTEVAAPGDTVAYTYTVINVGDCTLYDVSLVDDIVGSIALGLTELAQGAQVTVSADYLVTFDDPEWLENTATASGTDELELTVEDVDSWTVHTMGARTIGYWKNHEDDWCAFPEGSKFYAENQGNKSELLTYFPGNDIEVDGVNPLEMLRAQLIAAELNVACFDVDFDYNRYEGDLGVYGTIYDVIAAAETFLSSFSNDLNTDWSELGKQDQKDCKKIANPLKDTLEEFNKMGDEIWE
jgi:uncharacterized repeat protein (TIGR01451 family)